MNLDALIVRSLLIVLVGLALAFLLGKRTAATRHLVYAGTMLSLVLLPVLRQWAPTRTVPLESLPTPIRSLASTVEAAPAVTFTLPSVQGQVASIPVGRLIVDAVLAVWAIGCL